MKKYWLWVRIPHGKTKSGYEFNTQKEAEEYYIQHFRDNNVEMEIKFEEANTKGGS